MDFRKTFVVEPGSKVRLARVDPAFTGEHASHEQALPVIQKHLQKLSEQQYLLYADGSRSLLVVLQGIDAAGKDGVCRHVVSAMSPQGCRVVAFKQPSAEEAAHDFLWRVHQKAPAKGEVAVFNRSHYEDVLVVRVHKLVPKGVWSKRFDQINCWEQTLVDAGTTLIKLFLYISKAEQLARFGERLKDPAKHWKISETDYTERELWDDYIAAFEDALERCSTRHAPWYVIPSNHKWFRNLAVSQIVAATMAEMGLTLPPTKVDLEAIARKYHSALAEEHASQDRR